MADGTITFSTALDNSQLETDLKAAEKEVDSLRKRIDKTESDKTAIEAEMERNEAAIHKTEEAVRSLRDRLDELAGKGPVNSAEEYHAIRDEAEQVNAEIAEATAKLETQIAAQDKLNDKWQSLDGKAHGYSAQLDEAKARVSELGSELKRSAESSAPAWSRAAASIREKMAGTAASAKASFSNAANQAAGPWETLSKKIKGAFKKVFVFSMIVKGVKAIKAEMSSMMAGSDRFTAGVENLKAVLRGFLSSVVSAVLPALTAFVNTLAGIFERVAGLVDSIFGTNISGAIQSQRDAASAAIQQSNAQKSAEYQDKQAKAEEKQAKAAKKLAKEQEKANAQLMGFDEINAMSAADAEAAADAMENETIEPPEYETDWTQNLVPDFGMLQGVLDWLDMLRDRILNDVEGPFARIREGLQQIAAGWGKVVEGFKTGNIGLIVEGFRDMIVGALKVIEGAFGALMDWLDEMTGGRFHDVFEGLKTIVHGAVEFIEGLLTGNVEQALEGLKTMVDGVAQFLRGILDGILGLVRDIVTNASDFIKGGVSGVFDELSRQFPQLAGLFQGIKATILLILDTIEGYLLGILDGVGIALSAALDGAAQIIKGALDLIVGLFTGNGDLIVNGLRAIFNGLMTIIEGVINGIIGAAFGLFNGIINGINNIPGISFPTLTAPTVTLPRLATGAVIPPNREFLAVLGDQKRGTNVEAPENLIRQIVREEAGGMDAAAMQQAITAALMQVLPMLQQQGSDGDVTMVLQVGNEELARATEKGRASLIRRGALKPVLGLE